MINRKAIERVHMSIPMGHENALSLAQISRHSGVCERQVKAIINSLRAEGYVIVSMASGGYFFPVITSAEDKHLVKRFIHMQHSQAEKRLCSAKSAEEFIKYFV